METELQPSELPSRRPNYSHRPAETIKATPPPIPTETEQRERLLLDAEKLVNEMPKSAGAKKDLDEAVRTGNPFHGLDDSGTHLADNDEGIEPIDGEELAA